jgi:hypothetical protein
MVLLGFGALGLFGIWGVITACRQLVVTVFVAGRVMMVGGTPGRGANEAPLRSEVGDREYNRWVSEACDRYEASSK